MKSLSRSSKELFRGARSVEKGQSFLNLHSKPTDKGDNINTMMLRAEEIKSKKKLLQRAQEEVEKKLVIKAALDSPKLKLNRPKKTTIAPRAHLSKELRLLGNDSIFRV